MNLDHLPINLKKDISLNKKKTRRSSTNKAKRKTIYSGKNLLNKFSKKQRRIINTGNVRNLNKLKSQYPDRFTCSICVHSDNATDTKYCSLFKDQIIDPNQEAMECDYIQV